MHDYRREQSDGVFWDMSQRQKQKYKKTKNQANALGQQMFPNQ